jgi:hypothetical protein
MGDWYSPLDTGDWYSPLDTGDWYSPLDTGDWYSPRWSRFSLGKSPISILQEALCVPEPVWTFWIRVKSLGPTENQTTIPRSSSPHSSHLTDSKYILILNIRYYKLYVRGSVHLIVTVFFFFAASAQVFLGFPVSISKCWDGSQDSKLPLHASHVALPS